MLPRSESYVAGIKKKPQNVSKKRCTGGDAQQQAPVETGGRGWTDNCRPVSLHNSGRRRRKISPEQPSTRSLRRLSATLPIISSGSMDKLTIISGCLFLAADIFAIASIANPDWINTGESAGKGSKTHIERHSRFCVFHFRVSFFCHPSLSPVAYQGM